MFRFAVLLLPLLVFAHAGAGTALAGEVEVGPYLITYETVLTHDTNYVQVENQEEGTYHILVLGCNPTQPGEGRTCTLLVGDEQGFTYVAVAAGCAVGGECPYIVLNANGDSRRVSATPYLSGTCAGVVLFGIGPAPSPLTCTSVSETNGCSTPTVSIFDTSSETLLASIGAGACAEPAGACVTTAFGGGADYACRRVELAPDGTGYCVLLHADDNGTQSVFPICVRP